LRAWIRHYSNKPGWWIVPGLINAHTHMTLPSVNQVKTSDFGLVLEQISHNFEDAIAWGVTTVRDMGSMPKILAKNRLALDKEKLLGPHLISSIGFLSVPGGYPEDLEKISWLTKSIIGQPTMRASTPEQARDCVKQYHDLGADFIKIAFDDRSLTYGHGKINVLTDAQMEAIKDEASRLGMPVAAHHMYSNGLDRGLRFGVDSMEHLVSDMDLTEEQIRKIIDTKMPFVPTVMAGINLAYKSEGDPYNNDPYLNETLMWKQKFLIPDIPNHALPKIHRMCLDTISFYEKGLYKQPNAKAEHSSFNPVLFTRAIVIGARNAKRLIREGVVFGAGNDSGIPLSFPGMIHLEMRLLKHLGMTDSQALRAATLVNARICKLEKHCGSIEKGKRADLVLLSGNPLEDIRNVAKVAAVFKEGKLVSKAADFSLI